MSRDLELRTGDLRKIVDAFESERDKLLDQVQYLKGSADRLEWTIKVLNGQIDRVEKEEKQKAAIAAQANQALESAREKGNVGAHPTFSERSADLNARREDQQQPEKKSKKKD